MSACEDLIKGRISATESFGSVDGPGIRFIVFMQGCRYRCQYCHNPETWTAEGGYEASPEEIFRQAMRYRPYWKKTGGITVSGGEPLLQLEFVTELFRLAKEKGVTTAIDTAGEPFTHEEPFLSAFEQVLPLTDLFLLDIKHIDPVKHIALVGASNVNTLTLAAFLSERGVADVDSPCAGAGRNDRRGGPSAAVGVHRPSQDGGPRRGPAVSRDGAP